MRGIRSFNGKVKKLRREIKWVRFKLKALSFIQNCF
jgi:hypothetical protein